MAADGLRSVTRATFSEPVLLAELDLTVLKAPSVDVVGSGGVSGGAY